MTDSPVQCPKCGGRQDNDLRQLRRHTGWAVVAVSLVALVALALVPWHAPLWTLGICVAVALLGVVALLGAPAARYCVDCNVRMGPIPDVNPKE